MTTSFIPRPVFTSLDSLPKTYFLGHHASALAKMRRMLNQIDVVIECRDSRLPLTSRNPLFEQLLTHRARILVYTKKDLAGPGLSKSSDEKVKLLRRYHTPSAVHFADVRSANDVSLILRALRRKTSNIGQLTANCMICGMPNVGKSTLLNALRQAGLNKGKAARTGAQPGITRKIASGVKIIDGDQEIGDCPVYMIDTPGVFIPYVPDGDAILKFALCGSIKDNIIPSPIIADYLLYHINLKDPSIYSEYHEPTNDVTSLLSAMAKRTGRLQKGGRPDLEATALWMVQRWRNGDLGRFMLDVVDKDQITKYTKELPVIQTSVNQAIKASKRAARELAAERARNQPDPVVTA